MWFLLVEKMGVGFFNVTMSRSRGNRIHVSWLVRNHDHFTCFLIYIDRAVIQQLSYNMILDDLISYNRSFLTVWFLMIWLSPFSTLLIFFLLNQCSHAFNIQTSQYNICFASLGNRGVGKSSNFGKGKEVAHP